MTLKNNRTPLLCCFKLYASFHSHWWIQTKVTVRKRSIWVKINDLLAMWPWNLTDDLQKNKQHQALCIITSPYVNSNWSYSPETAKWGHDLCDLDLWHLTLTFCMDITSVIGNHSCKFHDDTMRGTLRQKVSQTDGQTDKQTEITVLRAAWSQLKTMILLRFPQHSTLITELNVHVQMS